MTIVVVLPSGDIPGDQLLEPRDPEVAWPVPRVGSRCQATVLQLHTSFLCLLQSKSVRVPRLLKNDLEGLPKQLQNKT